MLHSTDQNQQSSASKTIKLTANLRTEPVVRTLKSTIVSYKDSISHTKNNDTTQNRTIDVLIQIQVWIALIRSGRKLLRNSGRPTTAGIEKLRTNDNLCQLHLAKSRESVLNLINHCIAPIRNPYTYLPTKPSSEHLCFVKTSLNILGLLKICITSLYVFNRSLITKYKFRIWSTKSSMWRISAET